MSNLNELRKLLWKAKVQSKSSREETMVKEKDNSGNPHSLNLFHYKYLLPLIESYKHLVAPMLEIITC